MWYLLKEFSNIKKNLLLINKERYIINNYIIGEFDIKKDNQNIRIINSYEESKRENKFFEFKNINENEIRYNYEIRINDELIPFSYFSKFNKKGKYMSKSAIWAIWNELFKISFCINLLSPSTAIIYFPLAILNPSPRFSLFRFSFRALLRLFFHPLP